jgi:uncharacterized membrane protein YccF (DUF307 family)
VIVNELTSPGRPGGALHTIGNILWFVLAGVWMAMAYVVAA